MLWFVLNTDGLLYNLGEHEDYEAANTEAEIKMLDPIWLIDEFEAGAWVRFIQEELNKQ